MKEFTTAVKAHEDETEEGWVEFKVDGQTCRAKRPTAGQVAILTATMHKRAPVSQQVSGAINFLLNVLDDKSATYLSERLLDQDDDFDLDPVQDIIEYLIVEWSGRPTQPSSDSSQSQPSTGSGSTENDPNSTSSTSESIAS